MSGPGVDLFDAHAHLQDERIPPDSTAAVLEEAAAAGVHRLSINGCWQEDWGRVLALAAAHPATLVPNCGLHPWWAARRSADWLARLRALLVVHPGCGLGECGLDKGPRAKELPSLEEQLEVFHAQLALAQQLRRPVSIHCVRAYGQVHEALLQHGVDVPVVLHSWVGSQEMVVTLLQLPDIYFSLSGYLTKLPPGKAIPMVRTIPPDRLLLESDSPDGGLSLSQAWLEALPCLADLAPRLERFSQQTTPAVVACTLEIVAAALGRSAAEVAAETRANAERVFDSRRWVQCGGSDGAADTAAS